MNTNYTRSAFVVIMIMMLLLRITPIPLNLLKLLRPPKRICNRRCSFVCPSVSNFAQKRLNGLA